MIPHNLFSGCNSLRKIRLPPSITTLEDSAFAECQIREISIPGSVTLIGEKCFHNCKDLKNVKFESPSSLTQISDHAFYQCTSLSSLTIPPSLQMIGNNAFRQCSSLKSVNLPSSLTSLMNSILALHWNLYRFLLRLHQLDTALSWIANRWMTFLFNVQLK